MFDYVPWYCLGTTYVLLALVPFCILLDLFSSPPVDLKVSTTFDLMRIFSPNFLWAPKSHVTTRSQMRMHKKYYTDVMSMQRKSFILYQVVAVPIIEKRLAQTYICNVVERYTLWYSVPTSTYQPCISISTTHMTWLAVDSSLLALAIGYSSMCTCICHAWWPQLIAMGCRSTHQQWRRFHRSIRHFCTNTNSMLQGKICWICFFCVCCRVLGR